MRTGTGWGWRGRTMLGRCSGGAGGEGKGVGAGELMFAVATAGLCRQGCTALATNCLLIAHAPAAVRGNHLVWEDPPWERVLLLSGQQPEA